MKASNLSIITITTLLTLKTERVEFITKLNAIIQQLFHRLHTTTITSTTAAVLISDTQYGEAHSAALKEPVLHTMYSVRFYQIW